MTEQLKLPKTFVPGWHDKDAVGKMKYRTFGETGLQISELSLGTGGFSTLYGDFSVEECKTTLTKALKSGINYIDTAPWYGQGVSEETLGKCLKDIPRKAYYIATKVGRYEKDPKLMFDFSAEKTKESIKTSLEKLGLDYVDVLQIHDIEFAPSIDYLIRETLPALQEAVKEGKAKFIGVTGYPVKTLAEFVSKAKVDMILSYSRLTLFDETLKQNIDKFEGLGIVNAAALAMGLLTNGGPQPWHPALQETKDVCEEAREYCKKRNVELANLAMKYVFGIKGPHTQLVGMNNMELLDSNLNAYYNDLSDLEKEVLTYLQNNVFIKLEEKQRHWEGVELSAREKTLKNL